MPTQTQVKVVNVNVINVMMLIIIIYEFDKFSYQKLLTVCVTQTLAPQQHDIALTLTFSCLGTD